MKQNEIESIKGYIRCGNVVVVVKGLLGMLDSQS